VPIYLAVILIQYIGIALVIMTPPIFGILAIHALGKADREFLPKGGSFLIVLLWFVACLSVYFIEPTRLKNIDQFSYYFGSRAINTAMTTQVIAIFYLSFAWFRRT